MKKKRSGAVVRNRAVFAALFAALISVTCFVAIPAGPLGVPIVMQNMIAVLAGAVLGGVTGAGAVLLFLTAGILGLPVFSGGGGGFARILGPTGGFLAGYAAGAFVCGLILGIPSPAEKKSLFTVLKVTLALCAGSAAVYLLGIPWLAKSIMASKSLGFAEALPGAIAAGLLPFIPGAIVKLVISVPLTIALRPIAGRYISQDT